MRGPNIDVLTNTNICIIEGRPKLGEVIPNIIFGIESGIGLPELYNPGALTTVSEMLADRLSISDRPEELACYASELGFHLPSDAVANPEGGSIFASDEFQERRPASLIRQHLAMGFRPWDKHQGADKYVKNLDKKTVIRTWGMLYCGGAKQVLAELNHISDEYQLGLHVESFAW